MWFYCVQLLVEEKIVDGLLWVINFLVVLFKDYFLVVEVNCNIEVWVMDLLDLVEDFF